MSTISCVPLNCVTQNLFAWKKRFNSILLVKKIFPARKINRFQQPATVFCSLKWASHGIQLSVSIYTYMVSLLALSVKAFYTHSSHPHLLHSLSQKLLHMYKRSVFIERHIFFVWVHSLLIFWIHKMQQINGNNKMLWPNAFPVTDNCPGQRSTWFSAVRGSRKHGSVPAVASNF